MGSSGCSDAVWYCRTAVTVKTGSRKSAASNKTDTRTECRNSLLFVLFKAPAPFRSRLRHGFGPCYLQSMPPVPIYAPAGRRTFLPAPVKFYGT